MPKTGATQNHDQKSNNCQRGAHNKNKRRLIAMASHRHLLKNPTLLQACCDAVSAYNITRAR